jgi:hypothetical protein
VPAGVRGAGYAALTRAALAGLVTLPTTTFDLADVDRAWAAARVSASNEVVVVP